MIFWILTPVPRPPHLLTPFWMGRGSKLLYVLWPLCVYLGLGPEEFFLYMDPLTHSGGPVSQLPLPSVAPAPIWPLASEDLAVFTLGGLFSGT